MLTLRRLAARATMVLVAIPLFGCDERAAGVPAAGAMSQKSANATNATGGVQDIAPADAVAMDRVSRIEGRHFDLYRHYRAHAAGDGMDDETDDDGAEGTMRHAVISFSASSLSQALRGCSMRALMAMD